MQKVKTISKDSFQRHIVIGGNGFLGQELVNFLSKNKSNTIIVVDLKENIFSNHEFIKCDISEINEVLKIPFDKNDIVHHLASKLIIPNKPKFKRFRYFQLTSVHGTQNILNVMRRRNCKKMIFWSTDMVYGKQITYPILEEFTPKPIGDYGKTKLIAEEMIFDEIKRHNLKCTIFRPRLIIGSGRLGILKKLFFFAQYNLPIPLIGNGNNFFQFISVFDCVNASNQAIKKDLPCKIYNLGSQKPLLTKELIRSFLAEINSKSIIIPIPSLIVLPILNILSFLKISPMDKEQFGIADRNMVLSSKLAFKELNWVARDGDLEMLLDAYHSYIKNK